MTQPAPAHECLSAGRIIALATGALGQASAHAMLSEMERCAVCQLLLGEAGHAVAEEAGDTDAGAVIDVFETGQLLGQVVARRYRVQRWIGKGGMGEVYEALDLELNERVALKTIHRGASEGDTALRRFRREVRLARQVVHENVCRVLEFGRDDDTTNEPTCFLTMELLRGEPLSQRLQREGRLHPAQALDIAIQVCAGLGAIHQAGILHRDVKPSNIMLRSAASDTAPGSLHVWVLDFGIAAALGDTADASAHEGMSDTQRMSAAALMQTLSTRGAIGTPDYMAPEQIILGDLSFAADIYALGVVLFEMLTGQKPFPSGRSDRLIAARLFATEDPPRPSCYRESIDPRLDALVHRCLHPDPPERPQTATELAHLLQELRQPSDDTQPEPKTHPVTRRSPSFAVSRASLSSLLLTTTCAGAIGLGWQAWSAPKAESTTTSALAVPAAPSPPAPPLSETATPPSPSPIATVVQLTPIRHTSGSPSLERSTPVRHKAPPKHADNPSPLAIVQKPLAKANTGVSKANPEHPGREPAECSPPYFYDAEGLKIFRKECL